MPGSFHSIYSHGFIRTVVAIPKVAVAHPEFNAAHTLDLARRASDLNAAVVLFPELGISAYSNEDLFHQEALLDGVKRALSDILRESCKLTPILLVGAPLRFEGKLFNCAVVIYRGKILGIVPKTYLPNYREFYEKRQFVSARAAVNPTVAILGETVPLGNDLIFDAINVDGFMLHVEICEDVWAPIPPSTYGALAGATILANLSASNILVGKSEYRKALCASQSAKCIAAYLYSAAGPGESTTDLAWDGHALIYENNDLLAEATRFENKEQIITADVDLERLMQDRMRMTSFNDNVAEHREPLGRLRRIPFTFKMPEGDIPLMRRVERFPYVPSDPNVRDRHCYEVYNIQVHALVKRLSAANVDKVVIGVSGGLDSTQALIVTARAMDLLGKPRKNILGFTMPGFATSRTTLENAHKLMTALQITPHEIDIRPSAMQMLKDIGHPYAAGKPLFDITFENVQAGERTSHLFRLANRHDALVIGTADLSELALGWTTYGVGDQMSHYHVNASVPKTLIQYLIRWGIATKQFNRPTCTILQSILETEISPELIPPDQETRERPQQRTQDKVGPFNLQDFNLYYISRFGFKPSKVAFLCHHAWRDKTQGNWPDPLAPDMFREYDLKVIKKWLRVFVYRFFEISQFKRSALPNGPKIGSGGSLSPRSDWRAPSDSEAAVWLDELKRNVPE